MTYSNSIPSIPSCPEKFNIVMTTIPNDSIEEFHLMTKNYFQKYKNNVNKYFNDPSSDDYYNVMRYHIFGSYDIAFFTLSESDKFSQKIFAPLNINQSSDNVKDIITGITLPFSYKIISGIVHPINKNFSLSKCFDELIVKKHNNDFFVEGSYNYCLICNLKFNLGHVLGGGMEYFKLVETYLNYFLRQRLAGEKNKSTKPINKYILSRTFSWSDLNLTIFCDDIEKLTDLLIEIRQMKFNSLSIFKRKFDQILEKTLHSKLKYSKEKIENSHLFIETQSYFGVSFEKFNQNHNNIEGNLVTQIEMKVKCGHEYEILKLLKAHNNIDNSNILYDSTKFIFGPTDLFFPEKSDSIRNNIEFFRAYKTSVLKNHVRKIRTRVFSKLTSKSDENKIENNSSLPERILDFNSKLKNFTIEDTEISNLNINLKKYKVSRQLRQKIIKAFLSYNMGIMDPVLTSSFQDFYGFMQQFQDYINKSAKELNDTNDIEKYLDRFIVIYDKAFQSRILNTYLYEEMGDIDIDSQAAVQKLLSIFNSIVNIEVKAFSSDEIFKAKIVNAHLKNTNANLYSINFNIHHLTSPEFVYIALHKEILNPIIRDNSYNQQKSIVQKLYLDIQSAFSKIDGALELFKMDDLNKNNNKRLFENVIIDYIRIYTTFGGQLEYYYYFSWFFNLQNSSIYDSEYFLKEENFVFELKRIMFTIFLVDKSFLKNMWLPTIELANNWEYYYFKFYKVLDEVPEIKYKYYLNEFNEGFNKLDHEITYLYNKLNGTNLDTHTNFSELVKSKFEYNSFCDLYEKCIYYYEKESREKFLHNNGIPEKVLIVIYRLISFKYIEKLYKINTNEGNVKNLRIDILKRSWQTGKPLESFIDFDIKNINSLYLLDNQGGIFFIDKNKLKKYYELRDDYLNVLMDINLKVKYEKFLTLNSK